MKNAIWAQLRFYLVDPKQGTARDVTDDPTFDRTFGRFDDATLFKAHGLVAIIATKRSMDAWTEDRRTALLGAAATEKPT